MGPLPELCQSTLRECSLSFCGRARDFVVMACLGAFRQRPSVVHWLMRVWPHRDTFSEYFLSN